MRQLLFFYNSYTFKSKIVIFYDNFMMIVSFILFINYPWHFKIHLKLKVYFCGHFNCLFLREFAMCPLHIDPPPYPLGWPFLIGPPFSFYPLLYFSFYFPILLLILFNFLALVPTFAPLCNLDFSLFDFISLTLPFSFLSLIPTGAHCAHLLVQGGGMSKI